MTTPQENTMHTTYKLRPDVKDQWLAALRSGEYRQGRAHLHYTEAGEDRYCCLGVLCDLAVKADVVEVESIRVSRDNAQVIITTYSDDGDGIPPNAVARWAFGDVVVDEVHVDIDTSDMWQLPTTDDVPHTYLTTLNDDDHLTFAQIADLIEAYL